jgi:glycosyltransferase involved in cell wall biosynthesis
MRPGDEAAVSNAPSARCVYCVANAEGHTVKKIMHALARAAAVMVLATLYGAAAFLSRILAARPRAAWPRSGCILAVGVFHNPNWFRSHIRPLVRSGIGEVILVCDEVVEPVSGVRFECPPLWMATLLSRAGAKLVWGIRCALRYRPDLYMGYHIFPGALTALVLARLFRRPACYQDTSGPLELHGGGWNAENRVLRALQRPSALIERRVNALVREFDSVVVRGSGAEAYIRKIGYRGSLAVITGSVSPAGGWRDYSERTIDLAFVARLTQVKRPERFLAVVAQLLPVLPGLRAVVLGDGPLAQPMKSLARELGIESNVEFLGQRSDVDEIIACTRVFLLTSFAEGVSIAMLEAMAGGAVPVVSSVGDLADCVENDVNGYLVGQDDISAYSRAAHGLLSDVALWRRLSRRAVSSSMATSGIDAVAGRWERHLRGVMVQRGGNDGVASSSSPV